MTTYVLITMFHVYTGLQVQYSPPFSSLELCESARKSLYATDEIKRESIFSECVILTEKNKKK